jgi:hypothetical protein
MPIRLFNAKCLANELHRNEVSSRERGYYLAASFLMFVVFNYSGLTSANPLWSWLSIYEAVVVAAITVVGFAKVYEAAGGDSNSDFVVEFSCLYVPVSITTILVVWGVYWGVTFGFRETIMALADSHLQIVVNLSRIGGNFFDLLTFLAVALVQAVTFYRIAKLFEIVRGEFHGG